METIFVNTSYSISVIGIIWLLIIIWQYVTGRPYWGEDRDSMIVPSAIFSVVPFINIVYWIVLVIFIAVSFIVGTLVILRENAVEKREKR